MHQPADRLLNAHAMLPGVLKRNTMVCSVPRAFPLPPTHPRSSPAIEALGNPGWNFKEFQRYFCKSETAIPLPEDKAEKYGARVIEPAGTDGPIARAYPSWFSDLHVPLIDAYKALGIDVNVDPVSRCFHSVLASRARVLFAYSCSRLFR